MYIPYYFLKFKEEGSCNGMTNTNTNCTLGFMHRRIQSVGDCNFSASLIRSQISNLSTEVLLTIAWKRQSL